MDAFPALDLSTRELRSRLAATTADHWALPSNCAGWSVRALANHVIGGAHRYALLLAGADESEVAASRDADYVGDDPVGTLDHHQEELVAMLRRPGALHRTVAHRAGDTSGAELLGMRIIEQTLHAWDIARSVGGDEDIDESLCAYLVDSHYETIERLRTHGFYASPTDTIGSARRRLLSLSGRGA